MIRVKPFFAWYDFVGVHWDRVAHSLYIMPLPMLGLRIDFGKRR